MASAHEYRKFFEEADTDKSGSLDVTELCRLLRNKGYKGSDDEVKRMFATVDTSGDGQISLDEYMVAMGQQPPKSHGLAAMRRTFVEFDKNGDGVIDKAELKALFQSLNKYFTDDELQRIIKMADADNSGAIDYREFVKAVFGVEL